MKIEEQIKDIRNNENILEILNEYESFSEKIEEEIKMLKFSEENINENIQILEEVITENLGIYIINDNINDTNGGMVDTIHNVRNGVEYKNINNKKDYENRGNYSSNNYHKHESYKKTNKQYKKQREKGE